MNGLLTNLPMAALTADLVTVGLSSDGRCCASATK